MSGFYPSPSPSPLLIKPNIGLDLPPLPSPQVHASKRKNAPRRSLSPLQDQSDKTIERIVQLDVYSIFCSNPRLLYQPRVVAPKIVPQSSKANAPDFASLELPNMRDFKDTQAGAQTLDITPDLEDYHELTPEEVTTCSTLRIYPAQYVMIKRTMLKAVANLGPFKKREAQTWFRIDICILYDWFKALGWIPNFDEWASEKRSKKLRRR
ncbi:hypothetical protein EDD86DRAFT_246020 [Gorgonomyces haynaldii]|nr:hypothetical protein EDD86DRAFT_246020 [Gorgonomyces haynaldii]